LFIEDYMPSNVNPARGNMKTLVFKMILAITNEDTRLRSESKGGGIIRVEEWPTLTATKF
jgi:hypothetical protein